MSKPQFTIASMSTIPFNSNHFNTSKGSYQYVRYIGTNNKIQSTGTKYLLLEVEPNGSVTSNGLEFIKNSSSLCECF